MIYFVSDIHLGAGTPEQARRTERAFCRWLDMVAGDATELYLLGDIFDFWFEHHRVVPKGFVRVLGRLAELTDRGVRVVLFTGNHDMWCRDYLSKECGIEIYYRPEVVEIGTRTVHIAHGDNINIGNKPLLRAMNAMFRSSTLRWMFSWLLHPDLALKFGAWWSGKSRKSHGSEPITVDMLGYLVDYAREHKAHNANVELYIFGHMHLVHRVAIEGAEVLFLGDWSGDKAGYAVMTEQGDVELKQFDIDETVS
ncbi:MAG: UDP-2,3-diacylglucosamine diphosphatase [Alistipes sp.]|nr:UDP-2,3-diacylglucosamine diphosphatase [Alistipes sp.]